jgi:hypothetical protein
MNLKDIAKRRTEGLEEIISMNAISQKAYKYRGNLLQEIALRMRGVYTPPVVCEHVENTQYKD